MVPTEMEDGLCLLDVIGDPNLLNEFLDAEGESGTTGRPQTLAAPSQAQAEAQGQPSSSGGATDGFQLNGGSLETAGGSFLAPHSSLGTPQASTPSETVNFISSQSLHQQSATPRNGSPLVQGNAHMMVNPVASTQIQYIQGRRSASPATGQQYATTSSPLLSRSRTPSQSPVPTGSPMFAQNIVPNQTVINSVKSSRSITPSQQTISPAPSGVNLNTFQLQTSMQPPVAVANTMQVQGIIQAPVSAAQTRFTSAGGQQFIQQKTVVQAHPNIVQAQPQQVIHQQPTQTVLQNIPNQNILQAIQQNPGLLQNVSFNTGVTSSTAQVKPSSPGVNLYSAVQGSVQNPVGLQGTIIQTPQGKSILIPNQLSGQPITVAGLQNLQPIAVRPQLNIQQQANTAGITTLNNVQGASTNAAGQPQISVLNINPQGQQIVIQRAPGPGQQNFIVRTIPSNFIQLQTAGGQASQISTSQNQMLSQISQTQGSIPLQPLLNSSQGQQLNLLNQAGQLQVAPVTLNIANQNVNLPQVASGNFQPTQLQATTQRTLSSQPALEQQPVNSVPVISQYSVHSSQSAPLQTTATPPKSSKKSNKKAQAAANKAQQLAAATSRQGVQVIRPAGQPLVSLQSSGPQQVLQPQPNQIQQVFNHIGQKDSTIVGKTPLTNVVHSVPNLTVNQQPGLSNLNIASSISYSTANNTTVTTTVSHSTGHMVSHVSVASAYSAPLTSSSVLTTPQLTVVNGSDHLPTQVNVVSQSAATPNVHSNPGQVHGNQPTSVQQPVQLQTIQLTPQDQLNLQRIQHELKPLLEQKTLTPEQNTKRQKLILLHKHIVNKGRQQVTNAQGKVAQPQVATTDPSVQQSAVTPGTKVIFAQPTQNAPHEIHISHKPGQNVVAGNLTQLVGSNQNVVKLEMKAGTVVQTQLISPKGAANNQVLLPAVPANAPPGKLPISASPAVPTQLKIGTHIVTLNLTPQHKEKLVSQLAKMTPEQQQLFYRHQYSTIQRLQQQHQIQQQIQAAHLRKQAKTADTKLPTIIQSIENKPTTIKPADNQSPVKAVKRPATVETPKSSLLHLQLNQDQEKALTPDSKTPFKSAKEACQRLLRYHVFQSPGPSLKEFNKVDKMFEHISQELLRKRDQMFAKYQLLLLDESMKEKSTAEMVMIERMLNQDLTDVIDQERKQAEEDPESFEVMPAKYLRMSPVVKPETSEGEVSSPDISMTDVSMKEEVVDSETPLDVEHASSPENPLDAVKSPVRSVMSSSGSFKLLIRKNHAMDFSSPCSDEALEKKLKTETDNPTTSEVPGVKIEALTKSVENPVLEPDKGSPGNSMVANIKRESVFDFDRSESIQEVPQTPFKTFSGESHPHDMFFGDSEPCSPGDGDFNLHNDTFSKNNNSVIKQEFTPLVNSSRAEVTSDILPDMEKDESIRVHKNSPLTPVKMTRTNSETDAALEGLLSCSNSENIDGYQYDPDDFKPVNDQTDVNPDHFDISDPFDENGDFFGYASQYSQPTPADTGQNSRMITTGNTQLTERGVKGNDSVLNTEPSRGDQQFGLVGQYEAISPVSDRSGGFNEDSHQDYSSFFSNQPHQDSGMLNHIMGHSSANLSMFGAEKAVGSSGGSNEIESAVDSIMDFGGSGDRSYSPVVVNDHISKTSSQTKGSGRPHDLKIHPGQVAVQPGIAKVYNLNGGGDRLDAREDFIFSQERTSQNSSNPVLKEQMESAINSILSPVTDSQQGSPFPPEVYEYEDYKEYVSSPPEGETEQPMREGSSEGSPDHSVVDDDLNAAINSILM